MKLLSIPVLLLILAALPLAAAAADYSPVPMLAGSGSAPQLPSMESGAASPAPLDKPDGTDPAYATAPAAAASPRPHPAAIHRTEKPAQPGKPTAPAPAPSWQSLLPGSIQ